MVSLLIERHEFIRALEAEGVPEDVTRKVLRDATTIQRLSVAECNGDYPCDNGERKVEFCADCQSGYVRGVMAQRPQGPVCPNCRACGRITASLKPFNVTPVFQGDPRGCCVKLKVPSGRTDDGNREGLCVPVRRF